MGRSQLHQILLLFISNQTMMMVQPQESVCQDSTQMTLLEGLFITSCGQWGETKSKVAIKVVEDIEQADGEGVRKLHFILGIGNAKQEEIICYNELVDHLKAEENDSNEISDDLLKFRALSGHQGCIKPTDSIWKGCKYNVLVDWETGEKTYELLSVLAADSPLTCSMYAKEYDVLHIDGWKRLRNHAKRDKTLTRAVVQARIRQARRAKNICLDITSLDRTKRHWDLTKRTTTPNGLMVPGKKWTASKNNKCSQNTKGSNGIQTTSKS